MTYLSALVYFYFLLQLYRYDIISSAVDGDQGSMNNQDIKLSSYVCFQYEVYVIDISTCPPCVRTYIVVGCTVLFLE